MGSSWQEYWSGLPFLPLDPPNLGIETMSPASPALAGGLFTTEPPGKPLTVLMQALRSHKRKVFRGMPFIHDK